MCENTTNELALFEVETITGSGRTKISKRYYQVEAVAACADGLRHGGRGQLRCACGTGKTVIAQRVAELLCPHGGLVVILCPSVALVAQTLREWASTNKDHVALAVCSDNTVEDSIAYSDVDFGTAVTTNVDNISTWLRRPASAGIKLIVATHLSADLVGKALLATNKKADLLVVDEAHHSAGNAEKHTAIVHDDRFLPAVRRLYATATPRMMKKKKAFGPDGTEVELLGMDDLRTFGPVLYNYAISTAISDGFLDDYRVVVVGVTEAEALAYLRQLPNTASNAPTGAPLHMAVAQVALARAAKEFDLQHVLAFCRSVNAAAEFSRTMHRTLAALPADRKPSRPLYVSHVHGQMDVRQRERELERLADPPQKGWSVVANVRCLGEGVDVPAIDGELFTSTKSSIIDIVQAVGRALRTSTAGPGIATLVIPALMSADPDATDFADIDAAFNEGFDVLFQVVLALRESDEILGSDLDHLRSIIRNDDLRQVKPLQRLLVRLPDGYDQEEMLRQITIRTVKATTSSWWERYGQLLDFKQRYGHCDVPTTGSPGDQLNLGRWTTMNRRMYKRGQLPVACVKALNEIGFTWDRAKAQWQRNLSVAHAFYAQEGNLVPPTEQLVNGINLSNWVANCRLKKRQGKLTDEQISECEAAGIVWDTDERLWEYPLAACQKFFAEHGHLRVPDGVFYGDRKSSLRSWLTRRRGDYRDGQLSAGQIAALEAAGMEWDAEGSYREEQWAQCIQPVAEFYRQHGHIDLPYDHQSSGWLNRQRNFRRAGTLVDSKIAELDAMGIDWEPSQFGELWQENWTKAKEFFDEHGHIRVPAITGSPTHKLYMWLNTQLQLRRAGKLLPEREQALTDIGVEWEAPSRPEQRWQEKFAELEEFGREQGHFRVPAAGDTEKLNDWLWSQKNVFKSGKMSASRVAQFEKLGVDFKPRDYATERWEAGLESLRKFREEHGHLNVRVSDRPLYGWLRNVLNRHAQGKLPQERVQILREFGLLQ